MSVMALKPQGYMLKSMPKEEILKTVDNFFETSKWKNI
jgi:DNA-binding NarL/FixJ family response regulator